MTRQLAQYEFGENTTEPTLVIMHGLFGSARNWRAIAKRLSADRKVITLDVRNHGESFWDDSHSYFDLAEDLATTLNMIDGPVDVLGHSMGGKAAMILATQSPDIMNRLIVADMAPIAYTHSLVSNIKIMQALDIAKYTRRSQADDDLMSAPIDAATRAFLLQSLEISDAGNRWKLNLTALENNMANIVGFPETQGSYLGKTAFIRGEKSQYVIPEYFPKMTAMFPNHQVIDIPNAGHWVHAEAPKDFITAAQSFLAN